MNEFFKKTQSHGSITLKYRKDSKLIVRYFFSKLYWINIYLPKSRVVISKIDVLGAGLNVFSMLLDLLILQTNLLLNIILNRVLKTCAVLHVRETQYQTIPLESQLE